MPGFRGLDVDAPAGTRWDLALDVLESGDAEVRLGRRVRLRRSARGPSADSRIQVSIEASVLRSFVTEAVAEADVRHGLAMIEQAAAADPRFRSLLDRYGVDYAYVEDHSNAVLHLAAVTSDGRVVW